MNTVKRILEVLHCRVEDILKLWASCLPVVGDRKSVFGERLNEVTVMLRTKYKNYMQATVEKLVNNVCTQIFLLQDFFEKKNFFEFFHNSFNTQRRMQPVSPNNYKKFEYFGKNQWSICFNMCLEIEEIERSFWNWEILRRFLSYFVHTLFHCQQWLAVHWFEWKIWKNTYNNFQFLCISNTWKNVSPSLSPK